MTCDLFAGHVPQLVPRALRDEESVVGTKLEPAPPVGVGSVGEQDVERSAQDVHRGVAAVPPRVRVAAGSDRDLLDGEVLGAGEGLHERTVAFEAVERVTRAQHVEACGLVALVGRHRPPSGPPVVVVAGVEQEVLRPRVRARRSRRGRRREELEHAQLVGAEAQRMVPGVAAEEHRLTRLDPSDLAVFGVDEHHGSRQHVEHLVRGEHRPEAFGVAEHAARRQREHQMMDLVAGHVDPVGHAAGLVVPPEMQRGSVVRDERSAPRSSAAASRPFPTP